MNAICKLKRKFKNFAKNLKPTLDVHISKLRNNRQITVIHGSEKSGKGENKRQNVCIRRYTIFPVM